MLEKVVFAEIQVITMHVAIVITTPRSKECARTRVVLKRAHYL